MMEASICNIRTATLKVQVCYVMRHVRRVLVMFSFLVHKSILIVAHKHTNRQEHKQKRRKYPKQRENDEKMGMT